MEREREREKVREIGRIRESKSDRYNKRERE